MQRMSRSTFWLMLGMGACLSGGPESHARAAELHIGGATTSITPDRPVGLTGQMRTRIARTVESPVTATALALESREGDKVLVQAINALWPDE